VATIHRCADCGEHHPAPDEPYRGPVTEQIRARLRARYAFVPESGFQLFICEKFEPSYGAAFDAVLDR
jgi:hypothetical protein